MNPFSQKRKANIGRAGNLPFDHISFLPKPLAPQFVSSVREENEKDEESKKQRKDADSVPGTGKSTESYVNSLSGHGRPLPDSARAFFEPQFGYDFSRVRIHYDSRAADAARLVNARAFTLGRDIYFGRSQHSPNTFGGKKLMAHELVHVVQQQKRPHSSYIQRQGKPYAGEVNKDKEETDTSGWKTYLTIGARDIRVWGLPSLTSMHSELCGKKKNYPCCPILDMSIIHEKLQGVANHLSRVPKKDLALLEKFEITNKAKTTWGVDIPSNTIQWHWGSFCSKKLNTLGVVHELGHLVFYKGELPKEKKGVFLPEKSLKKESYEHIKGIFAPGKEITTEYLKQRRQLLWDWIIEYLQDLDILNPEKLWGAKDKKITNLRAKLGNMDLDKFMAFLDNPTPKGLFKRELSPEEKEAITYYKREERLIYSVKFVGRPVVKPGGEFFAEAYMHLYSDKTTWPEVMKDKKDIISYLCDRDRDLKGKSKKCK